MILPKTLAVASTLLLALPARADLYPKSSAVLSVDGKDYERHIAHSNYTSIVEFYSPHCIHCKNLMPIYEKAAQRLAGLAKVAAINCEKESNRAFCDRNGITGFPTLKISKPGKTPGKPIVEDYNGGRSVKDIVETVIDKIPNLVEKPSEEKLDEWIKNANGAPLAILLTKKPRINPLLKALAIEFKGSIKFAHVQVTGDDERIIELFEIKSFPSLILFKDGGRSNRLLHDGKMKKDIMVEFLSQAAAPNPDPAPHIAKERVTQQPTPEAEVQKPINTPASALPLDILDKEDELTTLCLGPKTGTCLLALSPKSADESSLSLINALTQLTHKRKQHKRSTIPAYVLPESNPKYAIIKKELSLTDKAQVLAINGKRSWWRRLTDVDSSNPSAIEGSLDTWVSSIQLGEGEKNKLPTSLITEKVSVKVEDNLAENPKSEDSSSVKDSSSGGENSEKTASGEHDEL